MARPDRRCQAGARLDQGEHRRPRRRPELRRHHRRLRRWPPVLARRADPQPRRFPARLRGRRHQRRCGRAVLRRVRLHRSPRRRQRRAGEFLAERVFKSTREEDRARWEQASPISHVGPHAPPFFVLHGTNDSLVPIEQPRAFVDALRKSSQQPVVYAELPGAQHAFETMPSVRTHATVHAVERFLAVVRSRPAARPPPRPSSPRTRGEVGVDSHSSITMSQAERYTTMRSPASVVAPTIAADTVTARTRSHVLSAETDGRRHGSDSVDGRRRRGATARHRRPARPTPGPPSGPPASPSGPGRSDARPGATGRQAEGPRSRSMSTAAPAATAALIAATNVAVAPPSSWPGWGWMITPSRSARTVIGGSSRGIGGSGGVSS